MFKLNLHDDPGLLSSYVFVSIFGCLLVFVRIRVHACVCFLVCWTTHYLLPLTTTSCYILLFTITHCYSMLLATTYRCLLHWSSQTQWNSSSHSGSPRILPQRCASSTKTGLRQPRWASSIIVGILNHGRPPPPRRASSATMCLLQNVGHSHHGAYHPLPYSGPTTSASSTTVGLLHHSGHPPPRWASSATMCLLHLDELPSQR